MKEIIVKVLHTLLRRFWHRQYARHPQQELNMNKCMLLEEIALQAPVIVTIVCSSQQLHNQDPQTANHHWSCISAFHVYYRRPATITNGNFNTAQLGLKTMHQSCMTFNCGPNFSCCVAQP